MTIDTGIDTEAELEQALSEPTAADIQAMADLDGDILVLGAGGKMGPSLCRLARRSADNSGKKKRIIAVARFSDQHLPAELAALGVEVISSDLLQPGAFANLPDCPNVIFMAAKKFGTTGSEHTTWAMNTYLPGLVAERYRNSRIVAFSTGNIYPLRSVSQGGATEQTSPAPAGEYAQSVLGRERMFEYGSAQWGTPVTLLRLNYAVELRYGVLVDLALSVYHQQPIHLGMGLVNVIWQRDANSMCLRSLLHCQSPPRILNITGPETLSVRYIAEQFGSRFGLDPVFVGEESSSALLNNAAEAHRLFGYPTVTPLELMDWVAAWIWRGGLLLNKPTHFEVRDGKF